MQNVWGLLGPGGHPDDWRVDWEDAARVQQWAGVGPARGLGENSKGGAGRKSRSSRGA